MIEEQKPVQMTEVQQPVPDDSEPTLEGSLEQAKRAFALKNYELAVEHYAVALEIMTKKYGEASPECVDMYFAYGKALLENAIAQSSVLGKEETDAPLVDEESKASGSGRIHFSEDDDSLEAVGETVIDLFGQAMEEQHEEEGEEEEGDQREEEADGEVEDDFNAAWEILEMARSLYEAQKDAGDDVKLKLADTYMALGDISLETEKLDQAASDYASAAALKTQLLPIFSRQIAEVHYKLCIVYDMTSGRLAHSIEHGRKAQESVQARLDEITTRLKELPLTSGGVKEEGKAIESEKVDAKGKGKATLTLLEPALSSLPADRLEAEVKDLTELLEEVSLRIEELKTSPDNLEESAPELVARELDRELNGGVAGSDSAPKVVHNLTNVVRKKRKAPDTSEPTPGDSSAPSAEKKAKVETETQ